jgi:hypothetical protein
MTRDTHIKVMAHWSVQLAAGGSFFDDSGGLGCQHPGIRRRALLRAVLEGMAVPVDVFHDLVTRTGSKAR